ncbi:uncharacterized protein LOC112345967 [Selaginella moellendorffii]|uniref:uncharacterized protein LOC112345967 n=1 Tax=Selaginella moellendorffii TaxID=88036 RepID=UPI000D1CABBB|nr:uncharacterized protein LOC112345967 [Selaginella moellendorffii]|eukprot:XP_024529594.1 uncharacterized protein LOC112345967 [Selaginella moellendorffii]
MELAEEICRLPALRLFELARLAARVASPDLLQGTRKAKLSNQATGRKNKKKCVFSFSRDGRSGGTHLSCSKLKHRLPCIRGLAFYFVFGHGSDDSILLSPVTPQRETRLFLLRH